MSTAALYLATLLLLGLSFARDRQKTRLALKKGWKSFENILPQFLPIILLMGMTLAVVDESLISRLLGKDSGLAGMALAAAAGSVTLIPGFIAFPRERPPDSSCFIPRSWASSSARCFWCTPVLPWLRPSLSPQACSAA